MKLRILAIASAVLLLSGCFPARIITVSSYQPATTYTGKYTAPYTTVVTVPREKTVTSTTYSVSAADDISLYLDLQAVGAAFAQSSSIQEFESILNNSSYIISNLDLNADGYVDYLRVIETVQGYNHVLVIQAVLGATVYQDVATLVVEAPSVSSYYVQIVGAPYIYGPNYYIRPVFVSRPPMIPHFCQNGYKPWSSPWYWDHFPSYYRRPQPLQLGHYQSYVNTFMKNHRYCNGFEYDDRCHYQDYGKVGEHRNDYSQQHPEKSFTVRTANIPASNGGKVDNARSVREAQKASTSTTTSTSISRASRSTATAGSSRNTSTQSTTSKVRSSGSSNTSIRTTSPSGKTSTVKRSSSSSSRSSAASSSTSKSSGSSATRSSSSSSRSTGSTGTRSSNSSSRSTGSSHSSNSRR